VEPAFWDDHRRESHARSNCWWNRDLISANSAPSLDRFQLYLFTFLAGLHSWYNRRAGDLCAVFFEQFCLLCGAMAVYAATNPNAARAALLGRLARLGLGLCAISFTLSQIFYLRVTADLVPRWIPPNQILWAIVMTIAFALAAIAILINRHARLVICLMALMLTLFGVLVWIPRLVARPETHLNWSEFALTFLMTGPP
jgi:hypothetical protein